MTMPTLIVEVGFTAALTGTVLHLDDSVRGILDTNTLASGDLFTDVTEYVTSVNTRRGATRADGPTLRYEAGTCTINFRNDDRRFDPTNLAGPYVAGGVTQVEPLRAVRIRASYGGQTWPLWRGFTDQWSVAYDGPNSSTASVTCFDAFGVFAAHNRNAVAAVGAGETTSARVSRILDSIGWLSGDRKIGTGDETVQSTTLADNVLTELLLTADTELGEFWMDADGRATFRSRSAGYTDARSAYPQALFGDLVDDGVDTTVNHATNPSLETDTANGWGTIGTAPPTIARDSTRAQFGSWSLKVTWGAGGLLPGVVYDVAGLTAGKVYTLSVYVWVPAGAPEIHLIAQSEWGTGTDGLFDQWVRLTWTGTATATTIGLGIWPVTTPVGGEFAWLDGMQVEESSAATAYVDGDQALCEWDGVAHASTSRRLPELPYSDAQLAYDALSITNSYQVSRAGGTEQTTSDSGSVSAYLTRTHQRLDLLMQTDAEALMWAEQLLARTALPELRFAALELKPSRDADRLWSQALGREIGDRLRVVRRPPGGGNPIEREAWVRGIEHQMPVNQDWQTTLVLEQARDVTTVVDTFTRTGSSGLGTADSGEAWTTSGGSASDYSTTGTKGRLSLGSVNVARSATLATVDEAFLDILLTGVTISATPSGAACECGIRVCWDSVGDSYNEARWFWTTANTVTTNLRQRSAGVDTATSAFPAVASATSATPLSVRFQVVGTTLRSRVWLTANTEPTTWSITQTTPGLIASGPVGVRPFLAAGNTNALPVTVDIDSITVTTLHAWA